MYSKKPFRQVDGQVLKTIFNDLLNNGVEKSIFRNFVEGKQICVASDKMISKKGESKFGEQYGSPGFDMVSFVKNGDCGLLLMEEVRYQVPRGSRKVQNVEVNNGTQFISAFVLKLYLSIFIVLSV